jgi:hypothetical protein
MVEGKDIFQMSDERVQAESGWRLVDDISKTTDHIRALAQSTVQKNAGVLMSDGYINRGANESPEQFQSRLKLTYLPAGYSETVGDAAAKITRREKWFELSENIHPDVAELLQNVDMNGNSLEVVAGNLAYGMINYGVDGGYIDHGDVESYSIEFENEHGRPPSAKEIPANLDRPYFVHVCPRAVVNTSTRNIAGIESPELVVAKEEDKEGEEKHKVFKVTNLGYSIETIENVGGEYMATSHVSPKIKNQPIHDMPWVVGYASKQVKKGYYTATPLLYRLAENTIELMNAKSLLDYLISVIQIPILKWTTRDGKNTIPVGAGVAVKLSPGDTLDYVSTDFGEAVKSGKDRLDRIKDERAHLGMASMLSSQPGAITATTKTLDTVQADSKLHSVALGLEDLISNIIAWFHIWKGLPVPEGKLFAINMDFGLPEKPDMAESEQITQDWHAGLISSRTALEAKKKSTPSLSDMDVDAELELIGSREE